MRRNWIAVASADHVRRGLNEGIMQVCHGKLAPLRQVRPRDRIVYYSPTVEFRGKAKMQAFTAIGIVKVGEPYQFDMGDGFLPFRRDVFWLPAQEASILPLLGTLEFSVGTANWGYRFRFGIFSISDADMDVIAQAMSTEFPSIPLFSGNVGECRS